MQGKEKENRFKLFKRYQPCIRNKIEENEELKNKQIYIKALTGSTDLLIDVNRKIFGSGKTKKIRVV